MLLESKVKITSSRERNAVKLQKPKENLKAVLVVPQYEINNFYIVIVGAIPSENLKGHVCWNEAHVDTTICLFLRFLVLTYLFKFYHYY